MPRKKLPNRTFDWTPELAYAVGLITTDGNLSPDGRHLSLRSSDLQLLETFRFCLNISNRIAQTQNNGYAKKPSYKIQFGSVQFYRWLVGVGLMPNKSHIIGRLHIPDEYFRDFLRGHLDGDGSITTYQDRYNTFKSPEYVYTRLWVRFISASRPHIDWLRATITKLCEIKGHHSQSKVYPEHPTSMSVLKFGKKESLTLLHWIYYQPDLPCLIRKRQVADKFLLRRDGVDVTIA